MAHSVNGKIAIKPIKSTQIEAKISRGMATVAQRTDTVVSELIMDFGEYEAGTSTVILKGDAGFSAWNKKVMEYKGQHFVLCPITEVIGWESND
jgi:hypothetical protein